MVAVYTVASGIALAVLAFGPPLVLAAWCLRSRRLPRFIFYVPTSIVICTIAFAVAFLAADRALETRFHEIAPGGSWTAADEAAWSPEEQQVKRAYFGDGGRNVFALFTPIILFVYSLGVWATAGAAKFALTRWRRDRASAV